MKSYAFSLALFVSFLSFGQNEPVHMGEIQSPFEISDLFRIATMSNKEFRQLANEKGFIYMMSSDVGTTYEVHSYNFLIMDVILLQHFPLDKRVVLLLRNVTSSSYQAYLETIEKLGFFMYSREYSNGSVLLTYEKENNPFNVLTLYSSNAELAKGGTPIMDEIMHLNSLAFDVQKE